MALFYKPYKIYFNDNYKKIKIRYPLQVQKCNVKHYKMIIKTKYNSMDVRETGSFRASSVLSGALTVEASLILPVMIFALTSVLFILQIVGLWNHLGQVSADSVRRFSAMAEWDESDSEMGLYPIFLSGLDYDYIEKSGIYGGVAGLSVKPKVDDREIHLNLGYTVRIPFGFFRLPWIHLNQQAVVKRWTGLQLEKDTDNDDDNDLKVYMAENGSVYHRDRECTH